MELHYLTLKRQADDLHEQLRQGVVRTVYTQMKNEVILQIELPPGGMADLHISADPRLPHVLLRPPGKRARLSVDVLEELAGKTIAEIGILPGERVIFFDLAGTNLSLYAQLFRNHSNLFIIDENKRIVNAFKNRKTHQGKTFLLKPNPQINPLEASSDEFLSSGGMEEDIPVSFFLKKKILLTTPLIIREVCFRTGIKEKQSIRELPAEIKIRLYDEFHSFLEACKIDKPRIYFKDDVPEFFALTHFEIFAQQRVEEFDSVNDALAVFIYQGQKTARLQQKKEKLLGTLRRKSQQLQQIISSLENMPDENDRRAYFQKIGELLLAQLHQVQAQNGEVKLTDYYDPELRQISVRINDQMTLQENAQNFFRKAKESGERRKELQQRLRYLRDQLNHVEDIREKLDTELPYKEMTRIEKQLTAMHLLQTDTDRMEEVYRPYKQYFFESFEIWVGKSAKANDEMTFRYAHKLDWWCHAQGVSGAHVVIRSGAGQQKPPRRVIEYAARLAAAGSEAKHSSYVPVLVTQIRYLRKPRGAAPGAVVPERTETVFVEPLRQGY